MKMNTVKMGTLINKNKLSYSFTVLAFFFLTSVQCQSGIWSSFKIEDQLHKSNSKRVTIVPNARTLVLDFKALEKTLDESPNSFIESQSDQYQEIALPLPDGSSARFNIQISSIMHPKLAKQFPHIKSYAGVGIDDPTASIQMSVGDDGFHAQILSSESPTIYIDPYYFKDHKYYMSFYKNDIIADPSHPFECHVEHEEGHETFHAHAKSGDCKHRLYDLVVACTGEYASFHGGTVSGAMSAINTTMTRVNGIYEKETAISMQLVSNNASVIYLDAATDPYSNNNGSAMLNENQTTCDNVIGTQNYDIGHVFSTGGGGIAQLNSPCVSTTKAKGVTGDSNPVGDAFDVDYVAHEIGHQFGGRHTFNNACSGNRSNSTAYEPGSGNTIMSYAGICSPNVQNNSNDYFHAITLQEIGNYVTNGNGSGCPLTTTTSNSSPSVTAPTDKTIPADTPFFLEATGSDPNAGDALTYCWEQWDRQIATMPPESTATSGPNFRSFEPESSNTRYFPKLENLISNSSSTWEVIPTVSRTMDFRVVVRDNASVGGCTDEDNITVNVHDTGNPFSVSTANTPTMWSSGSTETITWNVAGTQSAPISCNNVDILLSVDGGNTYPISLASNVTNNGSYSITVPNNPTPDGRIMVVCSNNIFFDVNNAFIGIDMTPSVQYCIATYANPSCSSDDFIDDVIINTISNTGTGCALSTNYSDYTQMTTNLDINTNYNLTVKACVDWDQYMIAVIDFNKDGDFQDSGEFFDIGLVDANTNKTISVAVPAAASTGNTRLRVMSQYGDNAIAQADVCSNFPYGEIEDYTVNIIGTCPDNLNVTVDYLNGAVEDLEADIDINADNTIFSGANIIYDAGRSIELENDFHVEAGAVFEAFIDGCGNLLKEEQEEGKNE